jgi:peptidoglycan/xylan/chitin deacetylase (PgdA/CDA1 family)
MNWHVWNRIEAILSAEAVTPILAIVPDNQDEALKVSPPNTGFWNLAHDWQTRGWTIGMHGYQHRFETREGGILSINNFSEFAGLSSSCQRRKVIAGLSWFEKHGVQSRLWIAPAHSFDRTTLLVLKELGFGHISDGFFLLPATDEYGLMWIPQQLWSFRSRPFGVWTICFHVNRWTDSDVSAFRDNVKRFRNVISSVDEIIALYGHRRTSTLDVALGCAYKSLASAGQVTRNARRMIRFRL